MIDYLGEHRLDARVAVALTLVIALPWSPRVCKVQTALLKSTACGIAVNVVQASPSVRTAAPLVDAKSLNDLTRESVLLDEAEAARSSSDYATARAKVAEAVESLLARPEAEQGDDWLELLSKAGHSAWSAQDARTSSSAWTKVLEVRLRTLPEDHRDVQMARQNLANTMADLGELKGARELEEKVLEVFARSLPDDHPNLQLVRANLAVTMRDLGDLKGARVLQEKVLDVCVRTLSDDHPRLQAARQNLAGTIKQLGDLKGARALEEKVLDVYSRTLPDDHVELQKARGNLAVTLKVLGDLRGAQTLQKKALEIFSRTLPDDHPDLQKARQSLALTIRALGDPKGARALQEKVLEVCLRTLPNDHPDMQRALGGLAGTLAALGDLQGARELQERVLDIRARILPDDHPDLQKARGSLAGTLWALGDFQRARVLQEKILEVYSRTLPDDHPELQAARQSLALTMKFLGERASARALEERVVETLSRVLPDDHPDLQLARGNLAATISSCGDHAAARSLFEKVVEVRSRTLPPDHPALQMARANLAESLKDLGDIRGAKEIEEKALETLLRAVPDGHPALQMARQNLARTLAAASAKVLGEPEARETEEAKQRCAELIFTRCRVQVNAAREALLSSSVREAQARCESLAEGLDRSLSFASGYGVFQPIAELDGVSFVLSETTRSAALTAAALIRLATTSPDYVELRAQLTARGDELAALMEKDTTSEAFHRVRAAREQVERELIARAKELSGGTTPALELDVDALASKLADQDALVAYRRYKRWSMAAAPTRSPVESSVDSLCAFVLRRGARGSERQSVDAHLTRVELGPIDGIEAAVKTWREAAGLSVKLVSGRSTDVSPSDVHARGVVLRRLLFDPLLPALAQSKHVCVALDDVLHLVPLDSLPIDDSSALDGQGALLGDRIRIETRVTLTELLEPARPSDAESDLATHLLVIGGIDYDATPRVSSAGVNVMNSVSATTNEQPEGRSQDSTGIVRGGPLLRDFYALPGTRKEVESIAAELRTQRSAAAVTLLQGVDATRDQFIELAPNAHYIHIATHGWFAPDSIRSWKDAEPIDKLSGLVMRQQADRDVKGMSPMLLCGLALAGANRREDELGRPSGRITAEEISALDFSHCELVVLSACDTNVGEGRAGQGVQSLQMALQMAGARSVITSLWKVPDEATKDLMLDFYRRLWVEKKPKWQALWEAKKQLRETVDQNGDLLYTTRDWAAWVLSGDPN